MDENGWLKNNVQPARNIYKIKVFGRPAGGVVVFQGYMEKIPSHYAVVRSKGTSFISFLPSKIIQVFVMVSLASSFVFAFSTCSLRFPVSFISFLLKNKSLCYYTIERRDIAGENVL